MANLNYSLELKDGFPQCNAAGTEQTWVYVITKTGDTSGAEISHWDLELCPDLEVLRVSKNGVEVPVEDADDIDVEIFNPPNENASCLFLPGENVRVIKWDELSDDEVAPAAAGEFNFVLAGCFQAGEIRASIKGGSDQTDGCDIRTIIGPTCQEQPTRGIDFSDLKDMDIIEND
ncbi:hypothetical protein [Clostridium tetani]|uniref:Uncharacterized protein n=1 Tax=Clostridium tetani TaxID=1513 RepID=A0ABY0ESY2_CLOTA|nr:hypothetical protein [Clostridium tetani]CDI48507.1 hypothetical protein BN906_00472 [Clostridium tetani 12124569]KHO40246.1 hypothetical protein OR62_02115 [Clostridium tetani]RXI40911.1 hypothetical protein DP129_01900 [Clostridium tetani]RXI58672.1 hypothetical protein DP131_01940 [Clostridium tetani]RXI73386.1 hypothetical protein DQN76_03430 [Clostridium tetani]